MKFDGAWRYDSPGPLPREAVLAFDDLIGRVAAQGNRKAILEHFKRYFAGAIGTTASYSSSESWAESDLNNLLWGAAENAPLFIDAFYEGCEALSSDPDFTLPDVARMNRVLTKHKAGYRIEPPYIVATTVHEPIPVPERFQSLDEKAQQIVSDSFQTAERLLAEGQPRQAVQEILWLMESVVNAFRGVAIDEETKIEEKYFATIVPALRRTQKGKTLDHVLGWLSTMHGYLSSPTGGGVRHGADLKANIEIGPAEGRFYCNIIRSYVTYLMAEHERLSTRQEGEAGVFAGR